MCQHTPDYPATPPTIGQAWDKCSLGIVEGCAKTEPLENGGDRTRIDAAFFRSLSDAQKAALIAHERAHSVIGLDCPCEGCADKVGGFIMRCWGWTAPAVKDAMQSVAGQFRADAGASAFEGARKAESVVARGARSSRGLGGILSVQDAARRTRAATSKAAPTTKPASATSRTALRGASATPVPATKPAGGGGTKGATDPRVSAPVVASGSVTARPGVGALAPPRENPLTPTVEATPPDPAAPSFFDTDLARDIAVGLVIALVVAIIVK